MMMKKFSGWAIALLALALMQGCATGPNANPADPLEPMNRAVFNVNEKVDQAVVKPVATVYQNTVPALVRKGVTNVFENFSDLWSSVNSVLQAKPEAAVNSFFRFTTNSLWGVGGIFDVATDLNIPKSPQNFGRTLGRWGVGSGPYLVLPLFGPSSVRDTVGTLVDMQGNLVSHSSNVPTRNSAMALRAVDVRANLLTAGDFLEAVSLDKYSFARDIYLQRHRANKSEPAPEPAAEERYDLPEPAVSAGEAAAPVPVAAPASAPVSAPVSAAAAQ